MATVDHTYHGTLTLLSVTTVDINEDADFIVVSNRGGSDIWARIDGTNPAANQDGSYVVPSGDKKVFQMPDPYNVSIKMYVSLACAVSVEPYHGGVF